MTSRVRIESDGLPPTTHVTVDGEPLGGVRSVSWHIDVENRAVACIEVVGPVLDVNIPAGDVVVIGRRESEADEGMELEEPGRLTRFLLWLHRTLAGAR